MFWGPQIPGVAYNGVDQLAHLNFILPSSTWLSTVGDVILGTKA